MFTSGTCRSLPLTEAIRKGLHGPPLDPRCSTNGTVLGAERGVAYRHLRNPAPSTQHPAPNTQHPAPSTQPPAPLPPRQYLLEQCDAPGIAALAQPEEGGPPELQ